MENVLAGLGTALNTLGDVFGISDLVKGASTYAKWKAFDALFGRNFWANMFSSIEDAETSAIVPISPAGIADVSRAFTEAMCLIRTFIDPEMAEELIGEMLSEGLSSAMETNIAGALATIMNVHRGSLPPDVSDVNTLAQIIDRVDYMHMQNIALMCGSNPSTILNALLMGADQRYREIYNPFVQQFIQYVQMLNDYLLEPLNQLKQIITEICNRIIQLHITKMDELESYLQNIANEHLARINQIHDNFEADYVNYASGILDYVTVCSRFKREELQAKTTKETFMDWYNTLMQRYDAFLDEIRAKFDDLVNDIWNYVTAGENHFISVLQKMKNAFTSDDIKNAIANRIVELFKDVNAYRGTENIYMVGTPNTIT